MNLSIAPGVFDILPENDLPKDESALWRSSHRWNYVESVIRQLAKDYGFHEIRTPVFERTELFLRSVGETTDIVSKEMYTFIDKGERSLSLRPEGTAAVMRSFIENNLNQVAPIHKFYYISPMFRYERAQAGRYRQHHQFGAEVIGCGSPEQDVEMMDMIYTLYQRLGIKNLELSINSIGDKECRLAFRTALVEYLNHFRQELSPDSQQRLETNPLRILDSKNQKDQEIILKAPSILDFLNEECKAHFESVQSLLTALKIPFKINSSLVRGLDYYNKTVFEIVAGQLGAQNSIAGGGRYDTLLKNLKGPDLPATGFGSGIERIIQTMLKQKIVFPDPLTPTLFLIAIGEEARSLCFSILQKLRHQGISATMDFSHKKINKIMHYANEMKAAYVVVIGEDELKSGLVELKEMASSEKQSCLITDLVDKIKPLQ